MNGWEWDIRLLHVIVFLLFLKKKGKVKRIVNFCAVDGFLPAQESRMNSV